MRIAFAITSLFPGGGLQRHCLEIAQALSAFGHQVTIYTSRLRNVDLGAEIPIIVFPNAAITNHQKQRAFARDVYNQVAPTCDLLVGFDKLMGLDVLYCADPSIRYRMHRHPYLHLHSRYRVFSQLEGESFAPGRTTTVVVLSPNQINEYRSAWHTEDDRLVLLPPTVFPSRRNPDRRVDGTRERVREQLNLRPHDWVWITIGVQPKIKGLDRIIKALTKFPKARLLVTGIDETDKSAGKFAARARALGVGQRITWLGHREDVPSLLAAADLMLHPARYDTTGTVILEAMINGLPVIASSAAGYSSLVEAENAGIVIKEPFDFEVFVTAIERARDEARCAEWSRAGIEYGKNPALYQGWSQAAELILQVAGQRSLGKSDLPKKVASRSNLYLVRPAKR